MHYNTKQTQKTKAWFSCFYSIWRGNGVGLFSKEKITKGGDKKGKRRKKDKSGSTQYKQASNIYSAKSKIESRAHYAMEPA